MRGPLQDIRRGEVYQPLAAEINAWNGAARSALFGGGGAQRATTRLETVQVVNQSGQDFAAGAVMGLDRPLVLPEDDVAAFLTDRSWRAVLATESHRSRLVFAADMIRDGESGRAFQSGSVRCQIAATQEVLPGSSCGLGADEDVTLTAGAEGYEVIWASSVSGGKAWAEVRPAVGGGDTGILVSIGTAGRIEDGQEGLYNFSQVQQGDPLSTNPANWYVNVANGVTGQISEGTALIERNRFFGLPLGYIIRAFQEQTASGPRWFASAPRGVPAHGVFNRGQVLRVQQDGNLAWDFPGAAPPATPLA